MFTGIVQGASTIANIADFEGLRTFTLDVPPGFSDGLNIGASVSVDGVCSTVTEISSPTLFTFDVVLQSLSVSKSKLATGSTSRSSGELRLSWIRSERQWRRLSVASCPPSKHCCPNAVPPSRIW